ncbi:threonyl-tRNA synthetase [Tieghemostelium lacteum]|uniref:Probable threonine--tRNA ligase, cytoplasmic n=1 Tax=Tieghemostelium lacteum TaxID=361077 RepID=L7VND0_TIELA|nr:threonyl-tRNA synthetase [Tieghemostelium lacteum]KYQ94021.1 threonyl-tRNA synthetase [Tieghemostelium lacteum]|eukprot:KYQ94021.1 threonyl-tRNA synthetase [Tieghemostelium lacteum]
MSENPQKPAQPTGEAKKKQLAPVKIQKDKKSIKDLPPVPQYILDRIKIWDQLKEKHLEELKNLPDVPIKISLPDGKVVDGIAGKTTPYDVAKGISRGLADNIVSSLVDDQIHDISRPITKDCQLILCKFDTEAGKKTFWHSSAHILGQAMERIYGGSLCIGPATADGFYYDMAMTDNYVSQEDYDLINQVAQQIVSEKQAFERLNVPRDVALELFKYNKYKLEIISKIPQEETVSLYRCGNLVDLCRGPHVPNTSYVKAFAVTKNSSSYWLGKAENDPLQRVYGVAFPDKKQLTEYQHFMEEAAKRDHRAIGKAQELFFFHPFSPGCAFFLPHGARIYNRLSEFIKAEYHRRGFTEVITPTMFSQQLWEKSGHWYKYKENMFPVTCDNSPYSLKPMNCPGHCLMFGVRNRSYRELPLRFADFGVLHRNELAGALTGLTRVRKFQQDDAHIFCTAEMIESEIKSCLEFMQYVYGIFGFEFALELSTRPETALGTAEQWEIAENSLKDALNKFGKPWKENPGDGAFYGPKIDIQITDALKRSHQCATIQLDFQLPERFELEYQSATEEMKRPVIIHRAILGSVERMMAILIEHTAGKWPFWLSPRQLQIVTVTDAHVEYAKQVQKQINDAGFFIDLDSSDRTLSKKIFEARPNYNFILIIGDSEVEKQTVTLRDNRDNNAEQRPLSVPDLIVFLKDLVKQFK